MNSKRLSLLIVYIFFFATCIYGQYETVEEQKFFQSRIDNPVKTEVLEQDGKYVFYAKNRSYYPYQLNISFIELKNLTPRINSRDFKIVQGRNRLFSISVKDKNSGHSYKYKIAYRIGVPSKKVDLEYPYLFPLSSNSKFDFVYYQHIENSYLIDCFKINKGDTVYNMRKGRVLAVPNMYHGADRISKNHSLEIMHKDGTIMIYENLEPNNLFIKAGTTVFPNQALGIINDNLTLDVYLYMIEKDNILKKLNINYQIEDNRIDEYSEEFKNIKIVHPIEIITKEMTKREKKRMLLIK
jgi:hypothetical protein